MKLLHLAAMLVALAPSAAVLEDGQTDSQAGRPTGRPTGSQTLFVDRAAALGVDFRHRHFGTGEKHMPENMGPGVAVFDFDGDGRLDLYFPQGRPWPDLDGTGGGKDLPEAGVAPARVGASEAHEALGGEGRLGVRPGEEPDGGASGLSEGGSAEVDAAVEGNRLYRQTPEGRFVDVTERAGLGHDGYGMGAATGDYDGDGDADLYLTHYGPNALYRNNGDGTFTDVTAAAGVGSPLWSMGSAFFDYERDGDLDLVVVNYVDFGPGKHKWCGSAQRNVRSYCHPDVYDGQRDQLYRNNGDGTFTEVGEEAGLRSTATAKGLGLMVADFDGDRSADLFVANDSTANQLYFAGSVDGSFRERALLAGVAVNADGSAEASMGVEYGDVDGDGEADLFLTHLDEETNTLYRGLGEGQFLDVTDRSGLAGPSRPWVGFGTALVDFDHDGDLDLFVANGHIIDNIELFDPTRTHRQPAQLFENDGRGRFSEVDGAFGDLAPLVARGVAAADLDRDGRVDLVVTENDGPAHLLMRSGGPPANGLRVAVRSSHGDPTGGGVRLELAAGGRRQVRWIRPTSSYLSQAPREAWFATAADDGRGHLEIQWPDGRRTRLLSPPAAGSLTVWNP